MSAIEARLAALGITLPPPRKPAFGDVPVAVEGGLAWVSGQLPWDGDALMGKGRLGAEVDVETGRAIARCCLLNGLSVLREALGSLDRVNRIVYVGGFVNAVSGFTDSPAVINGASDLLVAVFGEAGKHARAAVAVAGLPKDSTVEIQVVAEVKD